MRNLSKAVAPVVFLFFALAARCAPVNTSVRHEASVPEASRSSESGKILAGLDARPVSFERLIEQISAKDLVFVGEVHDNPDHHLIQIQILQALFGSSESLAIGVEFFEEETQNVLDRYIQGKIDEETLLTEADWVKNWGFDYRLYRPLLLFARQNRIKFLALNAPHEIVRKVARRGLAGLDAADRSRLAKNIFLGNQEHRAYLREAYGRHSRKTLKNFEHFYEAQCAWEETMAQGIARYLSRERGRMIIFCGNGHIIRKFGIPDRVERRISVDAATVMPYSAPGDEAIDMHMADYVWLTPSALSRSTGLRP